MAVFIVRSAMETSSSYIPMSYILIRVKEG